MPFQPIQPEKLSTAVTRQIEQLIQHVVEGPIVRRQWFSATFRIACLCFANRIQRAFEQDSGFWRV